ncbi:MAG: hypothetical protein IPP17_16740 [Bacteroidetes bacterium]|nr:hypothetical protein [Bacteroidota bacterium]
MLRGWLNYFTLYRKHDEADLVQSGKSAARLGPQPPQALARLLQARCKLVSRRYVENPRLFALDSGLHPDPCSQRLRKGSGL